MSTRIRGFPGRVAALLACVAAAWPAGRAWAQPSVLELFAHQSWQVQELTPVGMVHAVLGAPDGYLWMHTDRGLERFDGVRTVPWQPVAGPPLPASHAFRMRAARDGSIWMGMPAGLAIVRDERLSFPRAFAGKDVTVTYEDTVAGVTWVGLAQPGGLCAVRGSAVTCQDSSRFGAHVSDVRRDRAGTLWVVSEKGLWRWGPGPPRLYPFSLRRHGGIIAEDETGALLLSTGGRFLRMENGELRPFRLPGVTERISGARLYSDRAGGVWITTIRAGLYYLRGGRTYRLSIADGLSGDDVNRVHEDPKGNLWINTEAGLDRLRPLVVQRVTPRQGLSSLTVWAVQADPDGSVWLATPAGLNRWRDGRVTVYAEPNGAARPALAPEPAAGGGVRAPVYGLGVDGERRLWAGTDDGMLRRGAGGFAPVPGAPASPVFAVGEDTRGTVWTTYIEKGLFRLAPGGRMGQVMEGGAGAGMEGRLMSMVADPRRGGVWAAIWGVGVGYVEEGRIVETYTDAHGIVGGQATDLRMGSDGAVWATHAGTVSRIKDGRVATLSIPSPCHTAFWSMEDQDGALWMRTMCGLVRVSRAEVRAWVRDPTRRVSIRTFGRHELGWDYGTLTPHRPAVTRAADGRIWFADQRGAGVFDPRRIPFNETPPPVHVERLVVDGQTYDARGGATPRLPPRPRALEIQFTAPSLAMPEKVAFRFMLQGQDTAWREAVNQRRVEYSNLPPGTYRFRVMAANHDGVWNTTGATLTFSVQPAWNQTWWFRALLAAALVLTPAALAVAWQRRRARLAAERAQARFEAMLAERTRVARELHDTLLGDMAGVAMQLNAVAHRAEASAAADPPLVEALSGLGTQVQHTLVEARASVTALRAAPETLPPLHERLAEVARRTFAGTGIAARVEHTGAPPLLAPTVEAEILAIAAEAMTNARKHADARTVTVTCAYAARGLRVRVRDDGRGFDPSSPAPTGHWGLTGMRERAAAIGATLDVTSAPGAGTEVALVFPGGAGRRTG